MIHLKYINKMISDKKYTYLYDAIDIIIIKLFKVLTPSHSIKLTTLPSLIRYSSTKSFTTQSS